MSKSITLQERNKLVKAIVPQLDPLPAPRIKEAQRGTIPFAALQSGLSFEIPHFRDMKKGDSVIIGISSKVSSTMITEVIKSGTQAEVFNYPADKLQGIQGQVIEAWYQYFSYPPPDQISPAQRYIVQMWLADPEVDEAIGDLIPNPVVTQGANLRIRSGLAMKEGAVVSIYFASNNSGASFAKHLTVEPGKGGQDVVVPISSRVLELSMDGSVHMIYTVHSDQGISISRLVTLVVEGEIEKPQPFYPGAKGALFLDQMLPVDELGKIPMQVAVQGMDVGDQTTLFFYPHNFGPASFITAEVTQSDKDQGFKRFDLRGPMLVSGRPFTSMIVVERSSGTVSGSVSSFVVA